MLRAALERFFPSHPDADVESLLIDRDGKVIAELARTAVAVLLSDAAVADGAAAEKEFDILVGALREHAAFSVIHPDDLTKLLSDSIKQPDDRRRLFDELRWRLSTEQRGFLATLAWEVILADSVVTPDEEIFADRLGLLLGLTPDGLHDARRRAER